MFEYVYKDVTFPLDMTDVETAERYEEAAERLMKKGEATPKDGKQSAILRYLCEAYDTFFDGVFGEGAAAKLFGGRLSVSEKEDAYMALLDCVNAQREARNEKRNRYLPNRAQRRAKG